MENESKPESEVENIRTQMQQGFVNEELLSDLGLNSSDEDELLLAASNSKSSIQEGLEFIVSESSDAEESPQEYQQQPMAQQTILPACLDEPALIHSTNFNYRHMPERLTTQEMRSFAFRDISVTHHIPRTAMEQFRRIQVGIEQPSDYRTTRKGIESLTGVKEVRFDCCPNSCISYSISKYANLEQCPKCQHPRYKSGRGTKLPYAQYGNIPIAHRLKLMYADKRRSREMMEYRIRTKDDAEEKIRSDSWTGALYKDLKELGLFSEDTDIALTLSTDGVKVFKTRSTFNIWPLMLVST